MAHSCPECDSYCTCGGDIGDCQFDGTPEQMACTHCDPDDYDDEEDYKCPKCGEWNGDHDSKCPIRNPLYD